MDVIAHLEKHGFIRKSGVSYDIPLYTAYLLAHNLKDFPQLENHYIRLISYDGNNNLCPAISDEEIYEGAIEAFQKLYQKVINFIPQTEFIDSSTGRRIAKNALPTLAIREVLIMP